LSIPEISRQTTQLLTEEQYRENLQCQQSIQEIRTTFLANRPVEIRTINRILNRNHLFSTEETIEECYQLRVFLNSSRIIKIFDSLLLTGSSASDLDMLRQCSGDSFSSLAAQISNKDFSGHKRLFSQI